MFGYFKSIKNKEAFSEDMEDMGLSGFSLVDKKKIKNGYMLTIQIPITSSYEKFKEKAEQIRDYMEGIVEFQRIRFSNKFLLKVISNDIGKYTYQPIKPPNSSSLYLGKEFDEEDFFIDLKLNPHILIVGLTQSGKSVLNSIMLTNLIYYQSNMFELYLCESYKRDIDYLKECKPVKMVAYSPDQTIKVLNDALAEIERRGKLFSECGVKGVKEYNKVSLRRIKRRLYCFDEISLYMPDENLDTPEELKDKKAIWGLIWRVVKLGGEYGIHFIGLSQRSTAANLGGNGEIKSQLCRITFQQTMELDSRNVIDCDYATELEEQEIYCLHRKGLTHIKVPFLAEGLASLKEFVPEIIAYSRDSKLDYKVQRYAPEQIRSIHTRVSETVIEAKVEQGIQELPVERLLDFVPPPPKPKKEQKVRTPKGVKQVDNK